MRPAPPSPGVGLRRTLSVKRLPEWSCEVGHKLRTDNRNTPNLHWEFDYSIRLNRDVWRPVCLACEAEEPGPSIAELEAERERRRELTVGELWDRIHARDSHY